MAEQKKFLPQFRTVGKRPVIIVGERPGKQRKGTVEQKAFHGNKTGDFIEDIIKEYGNIIVTNAINYQESEHESLNDLTYEGIYDLRQLITKYNPSRIIALGKKARTSLDAMDQTVLAEDCFIFYLPHPSFVLRFNKDVGMYKKTFETLLKGHKYASIS